MALKKLFPVRWPSDTRYFRTHINLVRRSNDRAAGAFCMA